SLPQDSLLSVDPPAIPNFLLVNEPVGRVGCSPPGVEPAPLVGSVTSKPELSAATAGYSQSSAIETNYPFMDFPRLIEHAFPLKEASLDSVHEKTVRHGHISTLHIWPARRPLAACRAALIATLLPDPVSPEKRKELCE